MRRGSGGCVNIPMFKKLIRLGWFNILAMISLTVPLQYHNKISMFIDRGSIENLEKFSH